MWLGHVINIREDRLVRRVSKSRKLVTRRGRPRVTWRK